MRSVALDSCARSQFTSNRTKERSHRPPQKCDAPTTHAHYFTRRFPVVSCSRPATMLRPSSRTEARKKSFKKATDADEARRKREEGMIQIRKDKREEAMLKKRRYVGRRAHVAHHATNRPPCAAATHPTPPMDRASGTPRIFSNLWLFFGARVFPTPP